MPTHSMVPQDMMPMHMNMNPGMAQPHHMMASGMPLMGMPPNPMHHEHMSQSSMYNNSESAYHHHMQSLGCPPQHVPQQPPPQQLQQLPVQQPILPCTSESQIVSNSVPYSDPIMPPVHVEQPMQMVPEQQQPTQVQPQPQQQHEQIQQQQQTQAQPQPQQQHEQTQQQQQIQRPITPQSPAVSEPQVRAESPVIEQGNPSPPPEPVDEVLSPLAQPEIKTDTNPDPQSPPSPNVEVCEPVENDNKSLKSAQSRSLSPAELNEPQSLERDCWSGSEHDPPPPTLTAEVSPPTSPKAENETTETSVFNFTEDEEPPPPLHSLPDGSPRKLKGSSRYFCVICKLCTNFYFNRFDNFVHVQVFHLIIIIYFQNIKKITVFKN